jgi:antitoxin component YwqK of YwqJK toxin-antitoxin module
MKMKNLLYNTININLKLFLVIVCFTGVFSSALFSQQKEHVINLDNNKMLFSKGYKINGLMQGIWVYYYPSGSIKSIENYDKDKLTGIFYEYYENGKIKTIGNYNSNYIITVSEKDTLDDGQITDVVVELPCQMGIWRYYKIDGTYIKKEFKNCK